MNCFYFFSIIILSVILIIGYNFVHNPNHYILQYYLSP